MKPRMLTTPPTRSPTHSPFTSTLSLLMFALLPLAGAGCDTDDSASDEAVTDAAAAAAVEEDADATPAGVEP